MSLVYLLHEGPTLPDIFISMQGNLKVVKYFNVFDEQLVVSQLPNIYDLKGFLKD